MVNYREILRLNGLGYSNRRIAAVVHSSHHTIESVLSIAKTQSLQWPIDSSISDDDLREIFSSKQQSVPSPYLTPDYAYIHKKLAKSNVKLTLLWEEYCNKARASGAIPYMYTQFCDKYRSWARITKATMRINHKPGDAMQVDWAGDPIYITAPETGSEVPAYVFVAVLPCSWYTYAEVCSDMRMENWILAHIHAYEYFGGVTRLLIPDNCKTSTTSNTRYETIINKNYQDMAEHYGTAIVPARVRKPDDKAAAEGTVRFVSTWITAALRDCKFFSVSEAQCAVLEKLSQLNQRPFKKRSGNRVTAYEQEEKEFMRPLPVYAYEPCVWLKAKVGYDYLISDGINKYSVPYELIGESVDIKVTRNIVEAFYHQTRVAVHARIQTEQRDPVVKPEHMPENHRKYLGYTADEFLSWAHTVGPKTTDTVEYFINSGSEAEQGFKACASLTKLEKRYGSKVLEDACERVLHLTSSPNIRNISVLCKSSSIQKGENSATVAKEGSHGITRGAAYYSKGGKGHE